MNYNGIFIQLLNFPNHYAVTSQEEFVQDPDLTPQTSQLIDNSSKWLFISDCYETEDQRKFYSEIQFYS